MGPLGLKASKRPSTDAGRSAVIGQSIKQTGRGLDALPGQGRARQQVAFGCRRELVPENLGIRDMPDGQEQTIFPGPDAYILPRQMQPPE